MSSQRTASEVAHATAVREMFSGIARKYDFLNHFLSLNIDKRWRRLVAAELSDILDRTDAVVLDVACGTGDLSIELQKSWSVVSGQWPEIHEPTAKDQRRKAKGYRPLIIGADFCHPMLEIADRKSKIENLPIPFVEGDAMNLSFADDCFDAVTIAFGLRNLSNVRDGLAELHRVTKTGGRLAVLEFSSPAVPGFRQVFNFYFSHILPRIGGAVSGLRGAYEYLPDSVAKFPNQKKLAELMTTIGFVNVSYKNLTGGIAALHTGTKAESE